MHILMEIENNIFKSNVTLDFLNHHSLCLDFKNSIVAGLN